MQNEAQYSNMGIIKWVVMATASVEDARVMNVSYGSSAIRNTEEDRDHL